MFFISLPWIKTPGSLLQEIFFQRDTYVDDIATGTFTLENVCALRKDLIELLKLDGFELRKWPSNHPAVLEVLLFNQNFEIEFKRTKRKILSHIAGNFDSLYWITPIVFIAKCLMQQLWQLRLSWDGPFSTYLQKEWHSIISKFPCLLCLRIPRFVLQICSNNPILVDFSDTSEKGYAVVVYLKIDSKINLIIAKSIVAPLKTLSIPRLELCGVLLLSRLMKHLK